MKLLVLGGTGYIGTKLIDYLKTQTKMSIVVVDSENYNGSVKKRADVHYITAKFQDLPKSFFLDLRETILLSSAAWMVMLSVILILLFLILVLKWMFCQRLLVFQAGLILFKSMGLLALKVMVFLQLIF